MFHICKLHRSHPPQALPRGWEQSPVQQKGHEGVVWLTNKRNFTKGEMLCQMRMGTSPSDQVLNGIRIWFLRTHGSVYIVGHWWKQCRLPRHSSSLSRISNRLFITLDALRKGAPFQPKSSSTASLLCRETILNFTVDYSSQGDSSWFEVLRQATLKCANKLFDPPHLFHRCSPQPLHSNRVRQKWQEASKTKLSQALRLTPADTSGSPNLGNVGHHVIQMPKQLFRGAHVVSSWVYSQLPNWRGFKEDQPAPVIRSDSCSSNQCDNCDLGNQNSPSFSAPRFLTHQTGIHVCCCKELRFGMVCDTAIREEYKDVASLNNDCYLHDMNTEHMIRNRNITSTPACERAKWKRTWQM